MAAAQGCFRIVLLGLLGFFALSHSIECSESEQECSTQLLQTNLHLFNQMEKEDASVKGRPDDESNTHNTRQDGSGGKRMSPKEVQEKLEAHEHTMCAALNNGFAFPLLVDGLLVIDFTDALAKTGKHTMMVTAMSSEGTYEDDQSGYEAITANPLETTNNPLVELRLRDTKVDVYRPPIHIRTSDMESARAVEQGLGDGWVDYLDRVRLTACPNRLVVDATPMVANGFYVVAPSNLGDVKKLKVISTHPKNFNINADYSFGLPSLTKKVGFSIISLPDTPMPSRRNDDRLLYFDTQYTDKGQHSRHDPYSLPSASVDAQESLIWRHNLPALPDGRIRIHVDPSVPQRWRPYFREGIESWNNGFELIGQPGSVKAVLPGDDDWPADYNIADARYHTVSWDFSPSTTSMGIAKVDPRSGEIMKADIIMADTWVSSWLRELDRTMPNMTHILWNGLGSQSSLLKDGQRWPNKAQNRKSTSRHHPELEYRMAISFRFVASFLHKDLIHEKGQERLIGSGLKSIVMHEVGHILGLRHNFKGSMGISKECLMNISCTSKHGTTSSIMDYLPMNLPSVGGPSVDVFTPVIGAYDKLAIKYGYSHFAKDESDPVAGRELQAIRHASDAIQSCYDDDNSLIEDPTCTTYDLSSDPVGYSEDQISRFAEAQRNMLELSVAPGQPYELYGEAALSLLDMALDVGYDCVGFLGGINNTYLHRTWGDGEQILPSQPVDVSMQRRAFAVVRRLLRPWKEGLLPPADKLPYLVQGSALDGTMSRLDLSKIIPRFTQLMIEKVLSSQRLLLVYQQEQFASHTKAPFEAFSVSEFLSGLAAEFDLEEGAGPAEQALQTQLAKAIVTLADDKDIPEYLGLLVKNQVRLLQGRVRVYLQTILSNSSTNALHRLHINHMSQILHEVKLEAI